MIVVLTLAALAACGCSAAMSTGSASATGARTADHAGRRPRTPYCVAAQLRVSLGSLPNLGSGNDGARILFQNRGRACVLVGYPEVTGVTSSGRKVIRFKPVPEGPLGGARAAKKVLLKRGHSASAIFEGAGGPIMGNLGCPMFTDILVTLPKGKHKFRFSALTLCTPEIHPIVAGTSGGAG